ncbi:hypothetical protein B0H14DRAFT_2556922 [Mycena olivaceomarginata]|nr:hypothetical protein B0H14DRAFT_2556922 [Mycena olivaceomarginata]
MSRSNQHTPDEVFVETGGSGSLDISTSEITNRAGNTAREGNEGGDGRRERAARRPRAAVFRAAPPSRAAIATASATEPRAAAPALRGPVPAGSVAHRTAATTRHSAGARCTPATLRSTPNPEGAPSADPSRHHHR